MAGFSDAMHVIPDPARNPGALETGLFGLANPSRAEAFEKISVSAGIRGHV